MSDNNNDMMDWEHYDTSYEEGLDGHQAPLPFGPAFGAAPAAQVSPFAAAFGAAPAAQVSPFGQMWPTPFGQVWGPYLPSPFGGWANQIALPCVPRYVAPGVQAKSQARAKEEVKEEESIEEESVDEEWIAKLPAAPRHALPPKKKKYEGRGKMLVNFFLAELPDLGDDDLEFREKKSIHWQEVYPEWREVCLLDSRFKYYGKVTPSRAASILDCLRRYHGIDA